VNAARPDYVGFVFARSSRRYVTPERAAELRAMLDAGIVPVGVFTDASIDDAAQLAADGTIDMVQLHGGEDAEYIRRLRARLVDAGRTDVQVIKALPSEVLFNSDKPESDGAEDARHQINRHSTDIISTGIACDGPGRPDYLLVDNGGGGTGRSFDWGVLHLRCIGGMLYLGAEAVQGDGGGVALPFFLAGGIGENNIEEAINMAPYGIDVSSGAETDGAKDAEKIARIVKAVRSRR
jgi:phosphoribosylanthranilate isomerase